MFAGTLRLGRAACGLHEPHVSAEPGPAVTRERHSRASRVSFTRELGTLQFSAHGVVCWSVGGICGDRVAAALCTSVSLRDGAGDRQHGLSLSPAETCCQKKDALQRPNNTESALRVEETMRGGLVAGCVSTQVSGCRVAREAC